MLLCSRVVLVACLMFSFLPAVVSKMFPVSLQTVSCLAPILGWQDTHGCSECVVFTW